MARPKLIAEGEELLSLTKLTFWKFQTHANKAKEDVGLD